MASETYDLQGTDADIVVPKHRPLSDPSSIFPEYFFGYDGFEELKKFVKQGSEFSKEISVLLQERSEAEITYAKNLSKIAAKLIKVCTSGIGTVTEGWKSIGATMEQEADLHKSLSTGLVEDISKPLKGFVETQIKTRRPLEAMVEKSYKNLIDRRAEEFKCKKHSYSCCRDYEKAQSAVSEAKSGKGKDVLKLEKRSKQLQAILKKADSDYSEASYKAEFARQEWDLSVAKASLSIQELEEDRLKTMQDYLNKYNNLVSLLPSKLPQYYESLNSVLKSVDLQQDLKTIVQHRGMKEPRQPEQLLIDSYAEDNHVTMDSERRKDALKNYLINLHLYIDRERKGKEGVQKLIDVYKNKPSFADADAQEEARQKLQQTTFLLNFLDASYYKINSNLSNIEGKTAPHNIFTQYIETVRDKQNFLVSTLRLPLNLAIEGNNDYTQYNPPNDYYQELNSPEDEFLDEEFPYPTVIGHCKVLYDYSAVQTDELTIKTGDVINIYEKIDDGWWEGELGGIRGIFPSTYVEEC